MSYSCITCKYTTNDYSNYNHHLKSKKHLYKNKILTPTENSYICNMCNMCYKHKSNLYTHIKKCKNNESNSETSSSTTDETLPNKSYKLEILKKELKLGKQKEQFFKEKEKIYKKIDDDKDKIIRE